MRRLGLSLLMVVVVAVIGAGWIIDRMFVSLDRPDYTLAVAEVLGRHLAMQIDTAGQLHAADLAESELDINTVEVMSRQGLALPESLRAHLDSGLALTLESEQGVALYFSLPQTEQVLKINLPVAEESATSLRLMLTLLFYGAIAAFILIWLYPLVRRLQRLALAANQFGQGDLSQRISTHPRSQLHDIELEFNRMARRIRSLIDDNKLLSSAVSHDLKTPLARLRFGVDVLMEQSGDGMQRDYLDRISNDLTAMEQLVEVLLEFARLDQRLSELPLSPTELVPLAEQCISPYVDSDRYRINFNVTAENALVLAESRYTGMMMNNLVQNASKFAREHILVTIRNDANRVWLDVEDDGEGFTGQDTKRLLKPFEKGTPSVEGVDRRGHGLGLAIVHRIAVWHHGEIEMGQSQLLGGARVSIGFRPA